MKMVIGIVILVLLSFAPFLLAGCGSVRRDVPASEPVAVEKELVEQGQKVFMTYCHQCHPGGNAGVGPALNNKPLPGFLIKLQVRQGFGAMPAFSEETIDEFKLEALITYLFRLRNAPEN
jgi:mono/diheme cytochrome c family protein